MNLPLPAPGRLQRRQPWMLPGLRAGSEGVLRVKPLEKLDRHVRDEVLEVYQVFEITPP